MENPITRRRRKKQPDPGEVCRVPIGFQNRHLAARMGDDSSAKRTESFREVNQSR